jgi:hypothetical protein
MATCIDLTAGLDPSCAALNKVGGVNKRVWIGQLSQLSSYATDVNGYVSGITLATYETLFKFIGKRDKNSGMFEGTIGENVNTFNQSVTLELYHSTPADRAAIESLYNADDVFAFVETNAGQIEVFGIDLGLNASALSGGTGTLLNDKTSTTLTLSGEQTSMPKLFLNGGTLAASITYLDNISA